MLELLHLAPNSKQKASMSFSDQLSDLLAGLHSVVVIGKAFPMTRTCLAHLSTRLSLARNRPESSPVPKHVTRLIFKSRADPRSTSSSTSRSSTAIPSAAQMLLR